MTVMRGRISLAACLVLGLMGAAAAREAGDQPQRHKAGRVGLNHGGFAEPPFSSQLRVGGRDQPYAWPVGDRYRPVSTPFYGRAY